MEPSYAQTMQLANSASKGPVLQEMTRVDFDSHRSSSKLSGLIRSARSLLEAS